MPEIHIIGMYSVYFYSPHYIVCFGQLPCAHILDVKLPDGTHEAYEITTNDGIGEVIHTDSLATCCNYLTQYYTKLGVVHAR